MLELRVKSSRSDKSSHHHQNLQLGPVHRPNSDDEHYYDLARVSTCQSSVSGSDASESV